MAHRPAPPVAPRNLTATAVSATEIDLTWSAAPLATQYDVQRSTDNATWSTLGRVSALSYSSTGLTASTQYYYRVRGVNAGGVGPFSSSANATTEVAGNGLLNGLAFYWKALSLAVTVGPGPLTQPRGDAVTYGSGPVAGEGAGTFVAPADLIAPVADEVWSDFGSTDYLASMWLNPTAAAHSSGVLLSCGEAPANGFDSWLADDRSIGWETPLADQSYPFQATAAAAVSLNAWHSWIFWYTASDHTLHAMFDGVELTPVVGDSAAGAAEPGNQLLIAGLMDGQIASVGVWKGTIPDSAGRALLAAGTGYASFTS